MPSLKQAALRGQPSARPRLCAVSGTRRAAALSVSHAARFGRPLAARRGRVAAAHAHSRAHARRRGRRGVRQTPRDCWAFRIPAVRRSTRWRDAAMRRRIRFRAIVRPTVRSTFRSPASKRRCATFSIPDAGHAKPERMSPHHFNPRSLTCS